MKKIFFLILFFSLISSQVGAKEGLVPCGGEGEPACTLCHFFQMLQTIFNYVVFTLVPILTALLIIIGGVMFYFGGASPKTLEKAKSLLTSVVIGLVIIYGAWILVNTFFQMIGVAEWTGLKTWWKIDCEP